METFVLVVEGFDGKGMVRKQIALTEVGGMVIN